MLLDRETLEIAPSAQVALDDLGDDARYDTELREGQIEIRTPVCGNGIAAGICLADALLHLGERLGDTTLVAASGTHPFSSAWGRGSREGRYQELAAEFPYAGRRHLPCGLHVHVAVSGAERALAAYNAARSFLPELVALGAIELRAADSQTRLEDASAVAALFQCLLVWLAERHDEGDELLVHETSRIAENVWRARRYGTRGFMVDPVTGEPVETRMLVS